MPIKTYLREIHKKSPNQLRANWELSKNLNLGDVGYINNGVFELQTTLQAEGIDFKVRRGQKEKGKLDLSSEKGVHVHPKFDASGNAQVIELNGEAVFEIEFQREKSYVFRADGVRIDVIENMAAVKREVIKRFEAGGWEKEYAIITEIMTADAVSLLIAGDSGIRTVLSAKGNFDVSDLDIANADIGFQAQSNKKLSLEVLGKKGTNPLYKAMGLKVPLWFGQPKLHTRGFIKGIRSFFA
ncbi:MAG: hypothetical protein AAFQ87_13205 [Bacteroidota bacterium]